MLNDLPPAPPLTTVAATTTTTTTVAATATTAATTTALAVPDLTPTITGPTTAVPGVAGQYTITITNMGTAATSGPMTFTVQFTAQNGVTPVDAINVLARDWTVAPAGAGALTYTSIPGFTLAPGAVSTPTVSVTSPGSFVMATTLPTGIGAETNAANNSAPLTVVVTP